MKSAIEQLKKTAYEMGLSEDCPKEDESDDELAKIAEKYGISVKIAKHLQLNKQKFGGTSVN